MKTYKAKPLALPFIDEVQGELYTNAIKHDDGTIVSTGEYYLRNHYSTFDENNLEIVQNYVDYKINENTLEELPECFIDLSDNYDITWVEGKYYVRKQ